MKYEIDHISDNAEITVEKRDTVYSQSFMHLHRTYEIYVALCDGNKFLVGNRIYEVNKYDIFLFDNKDLHKINIVSKDNYSRFIVIFNPEMVKQFSTGGYSVINCFRKNPSYSHKLTLSEKKRKIFISMLEDMLETHDGKSSQRDIKLRFLLAYILVFLDVEKTNAAQDIPGQKEMPKNKKLTTVINYIAQNFSRPLTLAEISRETHISYAYLCRLFKSETGLGINDYVQWTRLNHSIKLLTVGHSVSETALLCGFSSDTYFISSFKRAIGITPKKYASEFLSDPKNSNN